MHQIDENKDSAMYNAYMGVEDRSSHSSSYYPQMYHHSHQYQYHHSFNQPPPPHQHQHQQYQHYPPQYQHSHSPKHKYTHNNRQYVSKREHSNTSPLIRTHSTPQRHQQNRHRDYRPPSYYYQSTDAPANMRHSLSPAPITHVPSKVPSKAPPKSIEIGVTKLETETETETEGKEVKLETTLVPLHRQHSEPDAKTMRDIERDLNALPLTPPFDALGGGTDVFSDKLGLPSSLSYSKTTPYPSHNHHPRHSQFLVNEPYYGQYNHQPMAMPMTMHKKAHKSKKKAHKNKKKEDTSQLQTEEKVAGMVPCALSSGFDFAVFDLNQQLKLIKKELSDLEKQISATESKTRLTERALRQTNAEKKKILSALETEKLVLKKSLISAEEQQDSDEIRQFWARQSESLGKEVGKLRTKNMAASASADVMHKHLRSQLEGTRKTLLRAKRERESNKGKNMRFELEVIELTEVVNNLKESVDAQRHDNFLALSKQKERDRQESMESREENKESEEYPPEIVIQQNLIRAQVEFYFSDYNLKRDKRLLEKICKEPQRGYLSTEEVLSLSRVRQLCNSAAHLYDSLCHSPYIDMILDTETVPTVAVADEAEETAEEKKQPLYVGRKHFTPPSEKQFPFRRSVYIYGLPWYADEKYIYSMLNAFGGVTKVHFDHGPDTLDRQIMNKMLEKHRVYKLLSKDSAAMTMEFNFMHNKQEQYHCYWCHKQKPCSDGYYHPKRIPGTAPTYRVCLQCAAAKAEEQCAKYDARSKLLKDDKRLRELLLGLPPRPIVQCKTALCVFASQRQASKCVYVRSRLAYDGAFATHYHHYSKLKKEIALSIKPKIRILTGHTQPNMLKTYTAPVYQQEGTAVIQPHLKK